MTNLQQFEVWAREGGRSSSLANAQEWCDRQNLAALQATTAQRQQEAKTQEVTAAYTLQEVIVQLKNAVGAAEKSSLESMGTLSYPYISGHLQSAIEIAVRSLESLT